jgi:hypothetical protein
MNFHFESPAQAIIFRTSSVGPIYGLWRTVLSHTTIFLKQSLMIVNGTKDPMDRRTPFLETSAKAGIKTKSQTMVSQTRPPVRRFSELRN